MFSIFAFAFFLIAGVLAIVYSRAIKSSRRGVNASRPIAAGGALSILLSLFVLGNSVVVQVPTKEYGVVTAFGKPTGMLTNGLHLKAPWESVTEMDASIQPDNHLARDHNCINIRIAHQATACADVSVRWRIKPEATDALFQDYRNFEKIRTAIVERELTASLNNVFANYDALSVDDNGNSSAQPLHVLADKVLQDMRSKVGKQIEVDSINIPVMAFDNNTQTKVNALLSQVAQTRIAQQGIKTNEAQAKANKVLAESLAKDPNVLVSKCLDIVDEGKNLPAGFSCWPGTNGSVVLPSAK